MIPRLRRFAPVLVLTAILAVSCSFPDSGVPAPDASTPAPAGVPVSDQTNVSPYPDLERVGIWNGSEFVQLGGQFDVTPIVGGHVIVMTHGWAVGWLDTYETAQSPSASLIPFWDSAFTDPKTDTLLAQNFLDLASALAKADPNATILMYSWIDQSSTPMSALSAYAPERATEVNGHRMATVIDSLLAPSFAANGGQIHLIGHSFGSNVATTAALALREPPRQLTLFDSPEIDLARFGGAKNDLRYKLPRLTIGRTPGTTFVDNYISAVGEAFHGYPGLEQVVDMRLAPPKDDNGGEKHEFPIGWYAGTVESLGSNTQQVGYAWSPLIGAVDTSVGAYWTQSPGADGESTSNTYIQVVGPPTPGVSSRIGLNTTPLTIAAGAANDSTLTVAPGSVTNVAFSTTSDSLWLTFDLRPGEFAPPIELFVDGRQRSVMAPAGAGAGTGAAGQFVILYDLEPGDHTLSIVSDAASGGVTVQPAAISNLAIVSTTDIDRNLTPAQSRALVRWVVAAVIVVAVSLLAGVISVVWWLVLRIRRRRAGGRVSSASTE